MQEIQRTLQASPPFMHSLKPLFTGFVAVVLVSVAGCAPMLAAGPVAQAGYDAAKSSFGGVLGGPSQAEKDRRQKLQAVLNSVDIGQDVNAILAQMGEQPKEKSGNSAGFTCYEYPTVYSDTDAAVIMSKDSKVVFYGNSHCVSEMQDANFKVGGKYYARSAE